MFLVRWFYGSNCNGRQNDWLKHWRSNYVSVRVNIAKAIVVEQYENGTLMQAFPRGETFSKRIVFLCFRENRSSLFNNKNPSGMAKLQRITKNCSSCRCSSIFCNFKPLVNIQKYLQKWRDLYHKNSYSCGFNKLLKFL